MKQPLRLGDLTLGSTPRVIAIVDSLPDRETVAALSGRGADLIEARVDLWSVTLNEAQHSLKEMQSWTAMPVLLTVRENGVNQENRLLWFERLLPLAHAVDIEIDTPILHDVVRLAGEKPVIVSEHDFEKTPDLDGLRWIVQRARDAGAAIVKIAAMARSQSDVVRLLRFANECDENLIVISMGELGTISRTVAPLFGSLAAYGFLEEAVAPGQLSLDALVEQLRLYYPTFRKSSATENRR